MKRKSRKWLALIVILRTVIMLGACKESSATTASTAATTGSNSLDLGRSDQHSARAVGDTDLADGERH